MPDLAVGPYARWWQLETWLRSLVYVELRAAFGAAWIGELDETAPGRQQRDGTTKAYMPTPDLNDPLAYLDARRLFAVIDAHWQLFEPGLFDKPVWDGRSNELLKIRNQIGHLRRPHRDDLARLEQTLRDLEHGARTALAAYHRFEYVRADLPDDVARTWVGRQHDRPDLVDHAEDNYDTTFTLSYSLRPWATAPAARTAISGTPGAVWCARINMRGRYLKIDDLWDHLPGHAKDRIIHLLVDDICSVVATFPAVESAQDVAAAITSVLESVLTTSTYSAPAGDLDKDPLDKVVSPDHRVIIHSPWSQRDPVMRPSTVFNAGAGWN